MILGIYGSGGAGREVKEIADQNNYWKDIVFIDDTIEEGEFKGVKRMPFDTFQRNYSISEVEVVIALGEPKYKELLYNKVSDAGYRFANIIHPKAIINASAELGRGLIIKAGAIISSDAIVKDNVSVQEYAVVGHDTVVECHAQISAFVMIAGHCHIGKKTYIGLSVPVKEETKIGNNVIVGMGSVVIRDIPDDMIAMGNPARPMKRNEDGLVFR